MELGVLFSQDGDSNVDCWDDSLAQPPLTPFELWLGIIFWGHIFVATLGQRLLEVSGLNAWLSDPMPGAMIIRLWQPLKVSGCNFDLEVRKRPSQVLAISCANSNIFCLPLLFLFTTQKENRNCIQFETVIMQTQFKSFEKSDILKRFIWRMKLKQSTWRFKFNIKI